MRDMFEKEREINRKHVGKSQGRIMTTHHLTLNGLRRRDGGGSQHPREGKGRAEEGREGEGGDNGTEEGDSCLCSSHSQNWYNSHPELVVYIHDCREEL
jgi:hypothetical protein